MAVTVRIRADVSPTEDAERIRAAIVSLFPDARVVVGEREVTAEASDLARLRELVRSARIPDSARGAMMGGLAPDGRSAWFLLGKQAAAAGRAHFGPLRSPLGDLSVVLEGEADHEVERAIYWIGHDTTVEPELAEVPHSLRPPP